MTATLSECRTYRYLLERYVRGPTFRSKPEKVIGWIMLNPSTADETEDDPTIRRVVNFSNSWGYDKVLVGNLFSYRATKPADLQTWYRSKFNYSTFVETENDSYLNQISIKSNAIVFAWGNNGSKYKERTEQVINMLMKRRTKCYVLGYTNSGEPLHPLMQPAHLTLVEYVRTI